ncbi:MAG TPA: M28 family peptidase [Vicinamibacterales bacterium]|nr:M28 family peptidase [Vicinamibacterales bacterium]
MSLRRPCSLALVAILFALAAPPAAFAQARGLREISTEDMRHWLRYLGSPEFRGRSAPSVELDLASRYIALEAERIGLQPLMPDGSFLQPVPVEVTTIDPARTRMRITSRTGELRLSFPESFTSSARAAGDWSASGPVVFAGTVLGAPQPKWDDQVADLRGKWVVVVDAPSEGGPDQAAEAARARQRLLQEKGALGIVSLISPEREAALQRRTLHFDVAQRLRFLDVDILNPAPAQAAKPQPPQQSGEDGRLYSVEVRHATGAQILGVSLEEMTRLVEGAWKKQFVTPRDVPGRNLDIAVSFVSRTTSTPNVVAWLPGSDPKLKNEYVVIGAHHDHNPPREGRLFPGADDNGSGSVGLLALAKALVAEHPRRSVIFVWHTAEERGLVGAYYFVQHSPVPVEKITANLNLDMISRNDPKSIYLIGSNKLSSHLDASLRRMNDRHVQLALDYTYEDPGHPNRFFFRSDHYPYIRYGIPAVWLFCGTTADYHQEGDAEEKVDYVKMEKVVRLTYLVALDVGSRPALLELDLHPEIKTRGAHNMKVIWRR